MAYIGDNDGRGPGWTTTRVPSPSGGFREIFHYIGGGGAPGFGSVTVVSPGGWHVPNYSGVGGAGHNLSTAPEAQANVMFGMPMTLSLAEGKWGFSLFTKLSLQEGMSAVLDKLKAVPTADVGLLRLGLWGIVLEGILPGQIAKDDPAMMSQIRLINTLPAERVTTTPISQLPTQSATLVHTRIIDGVQGGQQNASVIKTEKIAMSVPVVAARATGRKNVFTANVAPGMPEIHIKVDAGKPAGLNAPKGINAEYHPVSMVGLTAGSHTYDVIVHFPKESQLAPVYLSLIQILTSAQAKAQQEKENQRQREWEATHPIEVAEKNLRVAEKDFQQSLQLQNAKQNELNVIQKELTRLRGIFATARGPNPNFPHQPSPKEVYARRVREEEAKERVAQAAFNTALESRKLKEKDKKAAEQKLSEEKNKPRKGVKDYGHDYHPAPKTDDIKGLGELKKGPQKTPKQGGGGKRARWLGEKGRKIYEWDSQHGELEGYRASDGEHLGAFDPKTGKQVKGPDPKRNIKKYL